MLISGIFGRRNLQDIEVHVEPPEEVYAGTLIPVKIDLINKRKFMPAFLINVMIGQKEVLFPFVEAKSGASLYLDMRFEKRGKYRSDHLYISSVFPFNFFTRYKKLVHQLNFIIFPEPKKCHPVHTFDRQKKPKGDDSSRLAGHDSDILSIRDYVPGDPMKYISWKSTAKTGILKTKELSNLEFQPVIIEFDKIIIRDIEIKISCITFIILKLFQAKIPFGLAIAGEIYKPDQSINHKRNILRKLALYG